MRGGVRINNYVDNRVVLSGRKVNNDMQVVAQSHRPRPLIIHHINYIEPEGVDQFQKSPQDVIDQHSAKNRRKRTKTVTIKNNQQSKPLSRKNRASVSLEHLKKAMTSAKKKSASSSPSKDSDRVYLNQTQKKMKPALKNSSTLGLCKRSKSAIIKANASPDRTNPKAQEKQVKRKGSQKLTIQKDVGQKIQKSKNQSLNLGTNKQKSKIKLQKEKTKGPSNSVNTSSVKKVGSMMQLQLNKKKQSKQSGKASARKTTRNLSKSQTTSAKQSKPTSARQNHKGNIKKKLFDAEDRTDKKKAVEHINLSNLLAQHQSNETVKKMLNELQIALNTIGSRKKVTRDLQIITESVKALANKREQSQSEQQEDDSELYKPEQNHGLQIRNYQQVLEEEKQQQKQFPSNNHQNAEDLHFAPQQEVDDKYQPEQSEQVHQYEHNLGEVEPSEEQQDQYQQEEKEEILYDEKYGEDADMEELQRKRKALHKQLFEDEDELKQNERPKQQVQEQIYERIDAGFMENLQQGNPLLDRRGFGQVDMSEYDSVKSQQDERQSQISLLKKFQKESDLMMKKVKKLEIDVGSNRDEGSSEKLESKQKVKTPINTEAYAFERFPQPVAPELQALKSPKFSQNQIVQVIKLKERIMTDRHEKLGQLVNTLYSKHLVSPKTYNLHLNSLQRKYEEETQVLDHHRKHAEELAKLLSQIKKEREEIHGIDELIRSEKWEEAMGVIKSNQPEQRPRLPRQQTVRQYQKGDLERDLENQSEHESQHEASEESHSSPLYYEGDASDQTDSILKLVPVEKEGSSPEPDEEQLKRSSQIEGSLIKIDESNFGSVKPQEGSKGFDSNLFFIKEYCISLCQFVRDRHKLEFKKNLSYPLQYDLDELLEAFRTQNDGRPAERINSLYENLKYHQCMRKQVYPAISEAVFDEFNQSYENIKFYGKMQTQDAALQGIFLRSIYNALNQSISMERPGALQGEPLPWAHSSKHLKNLKNSNTQSKPRNLQEEDLIFGIAVARIIQWGSCLCGFIPDTVDLQNTEIDEEYINHIRETRMALLLEKMLADEETEMSLTELEETEVNLQLSEVIYRELMLEAAKDVRKIQTRNALRMVDY